MLPLIEQVCQSEVCVFDTIYGSRLRNVTFKRDFGPWKAGEKLYCLDALTTNGKVRLRELDCNNVVVRELEVSLCPQPLSSIS